MSLKYFWKFPKFFLTFSEIFETCLGHLMLIRKFNNICARSELRDHCFKKEGFAFINLSVGGGVIAIVWCVCVCVCYHMLLKKYTFLVFMQYINGKLT